jgi:hypothetical protein
MVNQRSCRCGTGGRGVQRTSAYLQTRTGAFGRNRTCGTRLRGLAAGVTGAWRLMHNCATRPRFARRFGAGPCSGVLYGAEAARRQDVGIESQEPAPATTRPRPGLARRNRQNRRLAVERLRFAPAASVSSSASSRQAGRPLSSAGDGSASIPPVPLSAPRRSSRPPPPACPASP